MVCRSASLLGAYGAYSAYGAYYAYSAYGAYDAYGACGSGILFESSRAGRFDQNVWI